MKILLVTPGDNYGNSDQTPNMLATTALYSALNNAGFKEVDTYIHWNSSWKNIKYEAFEKIEKGNYDIIGITCVSFNRNAVFELIQDIEKKSPKSHIILGGIHASICYEQILLHFPKVYAIVLGEGDITIVDLCKNIHNREKVKGIAFARNGNVIKTDMRPRISSLNDLSGQDYSPIEGYIKDDRMLLYQAQRGCLFSCAFCSVTDYWNNKICYKSPQRVALELRRLHDFYTEKFAQRPYIAFIDETFNANRKWAVDVCKEIIKQKLEIRWDCQIRAKPVDIELLSLMEEAGCFRALVGVESCSDEILKNINKKTRTEDIVSCFKTVEKAGLYGGCFLIIGLPGETEKTLDYTLSVISSLPIPYQIATIIHHIMPGTRIYQKCKNHGIINDNYWLHEHPPNFTGGNHLYGNLPFYTLEQPSEKLIEWMNYAQERLENNKRFHISYWGENW